VCASSIVIPAKPSGPRFARPKDRLRALRSVADRLLAMLCAMLRTQTLFDPNRHAKAAAA
jgi:hypothetical protein